MEEANAVQKLVNTFHNLHDGVINLNRAKEQVYEVFQGTENALDESMFNLTFPVLIEYFFDPVKKAKTIIQGGDISQSSLLAGHLFIRESRLMKKMFTSDQYPRSLLVKSATDLLVFMQKNPQYLSKILQGKVVGPMMLEIHPTDAVCVYKCRMCIWCGGQKQETSIDDFYRKEHLLVPNQWCDILEEAKKLGTHKIVFSGGGETLLSQAKIRPVLDKANSMGFETTIYTNGRTLYDLEPALLESILNSNWLRISLHAVTPEIYSKLVNRPLESNDLNAVLNGIRKIIDLKNQRKVKLKIGIGIVLQELNCTEVASMAKLCSNLGVDFLDIRVDCIGVTEKISKYQYEEMLESLRELRSRIKSGQLRFSASFAEDLLIAMDHWKGIELTRSEHCFIPMVRPAIDPFGIVGACDSIGEPYTRAKSPHEYVLGQIRDGCNFSAIMQSIAGKRFDVRCKFCMPGQISLNALLEKLVDDYQIGIRPVDQPFRFSTC